MDLIAYSVGFLFLLYASIHDFRTREVPDLVSYGLLMFAVAYGVGKSYLLTSWTVLLQMLIGLASMVMLALLMYYTGQWGGADSKLLMGLGALLGLGLGNWNAILFVLLLLFAGAAYGLIYALVLGLINRKAFIKGFKKRIREEKVHRYRKLMIILSFILLVALVFVPWSMKTFVLAVIITMYFGFYLWLGVKIIEESVLIKWYPVGKLTEGDWVQKAVKVKGKVIAGPKDLGITKEQIAKLKSLKVKKVLVKEGIPFVPSFLVAYVLLLALKGILNQYIWFL